MKNTNLLIGLAYAQAVTIFTNRATRSIDITAFQLSPAGPHSHIAHAGLWAALENAPRHVERCRILYATPAPRVPAGTQNDLPAARLKALGWQAIPSPGGALLHSKLIIIDGTELFIGSHNLTGAALTHNREISAHLRDTSAVHDAEQWFNAQWRRHI